MEDLLILVDKEDNVIGYGEKMDIHRKKLRHRAFSIFLYDKCMDSFLLQRRAVGKYHSGGLWSNSCCSHPRKDEKMEEAMEKRLSVELGIEANDSFFDAGKFEYFADYGELAENEIDYVALYFYSETEKIIPNQEEIAQIKWVNRKELNDWLNKRPEEFSAWFPAAYLKITERLLSIK